MYDDALVELADGLWVQRRPLTMLGLQLGSRMTVLRLGSGDVWLHSPVTLSPEVKAAIDRIGPVKHIVAPNAYHHVHTQAAKAAYPEAEVHVAPALVKKRKDIAYDHVLSDQAPASWGDELVPIPVNGCWLGETLFVHRPSRTAITADLVENFHEMPDFVTRTYLKWNGTWQRTGWPHVLKLLYRDHEAARASVNQLLDHDFDRLVIAHGDNIDTGGKDAVAQTFRFLKT